MDKLGSEMVRVSWWGFVHDGVDHGDVPEDRFDETLRWQLPHSMRARICC